MPETRTTLPAEKFANWSASIAEIVASTDFPAIPGRLCEALKHLVEFDNAGVFVLRRHSAPLQVLDDFVDATQPAKYVESPYLLDPVYSHFLRGTLPNCNLLDDICPDDFFESDYFTHYWSNINIASEFDINVRYDDDTVAHLSLSRSGGSRAFSAGEQALFRAAHPIVAAIMTSYWNSRDAAEPDDEGQANSFHQHLSFVLENFGSSLLTAREMEIVQLTMRGYSDKLSARELDITPGTVRNHKKSIFSKLQVSSQGQVFGLLLDVLELPANEKIGPDPLATLMERRGRG